MSVFAKGQLYAVKSKVPHGFNFKDFMKARSEGRAESYLEELVHAQEKP